MSQRPTRFIWACALAFVVASAATGLAANSDNLDELRGRALELVNQARREHGLPPLELGAKLEEVALAHAKDMLRRGYFSHVSPNGTTVQERYVAAGGSKWRLIAENIAHCAACTAPPDVAAVEQLQRDWMHSPEHRHNILHRGLTQFGFAVVSSRAQGEYAVQTFAGPGVPHGLKEGEKAAAIPPRQQTEVALSLINALRTGRSLERSAALVDLAKSALPDPHSQGLEMDTKVDLYVLLPEERRSDWASLAMLEAACGGCGTEPTADDARYFVEQWLKNPRYRQDLVGPGPTHIGLVIAANGKGKKLAMAVLGQRR